ncbi:uncharacterized protein EDB91DRAFT_471420 [Suillus paluster]|uniref:uncharacterized protein n=1 Tax=Suillus paluster TaxID=48578 RepID=UPI001B87A2AB|nr:uncharacterized protein EDB91DRAFT_471420 [Suillus paluster]KAG1737852.1 hypothetical protein EDB91DRAFT_471420 [Suillus paluster]
MLTTTPSMLSSQRDILGQCTSSTNDRRLLHHSTSGHAPSDHDSLRLSLQPLLEGLDRHCERLNSAYQEIQYIRTRIAEILASRQSEDARNVGAWDSSLNLQAVFGDERHAIAPVALNECDVLPVLSTAPNLSVATHPFRLLQGQRSTDQKYGPLSQESVGSTSTLPGTVDHSIAQISPDPLLSGNSGSVNYQLGAQSFHNFVSQDDTCPKWQTLSGQSTRRYQQLCFPVVQDGEEKAKCTWPGCASVVKKDNYTRHMKEIHLRQSRTVCASCGKDFQRPYMKKKHICSGRHSKRKSS